ncbi:hypothetical protein [Marinomonas primoryensis]|jgi:hypothetical protein|uniref:hypothetical protein n=1 Tax=Marinomonas primoryensis TaxID=178399 RepID=UPI0030D7E5BD|tara:strand:- start:160 stop:876 length:717 start_codon:yes stop_codon:yes gene_type:complete
MVDHTKGLIAASRESSVRSTLEYIAEKSLDSIIPIMDNSEILKDIPIIGSAIAVVKGFSAINNAHTLRKFANFIGVVNELNETEAEQLQAHLSNEKNQNKIIEETILYLDRYHNELKARLLGQLFKETFLSKTFTIDEYNSLLFSIDQIHPYTGVQILEEYYSTAKDFDNAIDDISKNEAKRKIANIDYQPLSATGLIQFPRGIIGIGQSNGASISQLGQRFYENVVLKTDLTELNLD